MARGRKEPQFNTIIMFALVQSGSITQYLNGNKGITIGDTQYPRAIFTLWSEAERNAIGIYTIAIDETNRKSEEYYINTDITYTFTGSAVTGAYGTATAKALDDANATDGEGNVIYNDDSTPKIVEGLKTIKKRTVREQAASLLSKTDWYVVKATEVADYSVPADITTYRAAVRTKSNDMEALIDGCADVDALATLYTYTETDGVVSRPLGEWPTEVS